MKILIFSLFLFLNSSINSRLLNADFIKEINSKSKTWTAGDNPRFSDISVEDLKFFLGNRKTNVLKNYKKSEDVAEDETETEKLLSELKSGDLPESYDAREVFPNCESIKEIRDQSACNSCFAFSSASAMSDRICIQSNQRLQTRVSSKDIISCCTDCGDGCDGGNHYSAFLYWQTNGIVSGGNYNDKTTCQPYSFPPCNHRVKGTYKDCTVAYPTPQCASSCKSWYSKSYSEDKSFGTAYSVFEKEKTMMEEIMNKGPVSSFFWVYADFFAYKTGVYQHTVGDVVGGHATKIFGWGVENGVKYWLCANSWNEQWGDKGFFKILRGSNHCEIESDIAAGNPVFKQNELTFLK